MKNKLILTVLCLEIIGCANTKYPNWQYVRIETTVPDKSCTYKMQESCSDDGNNCLEWHQKRATKYGANTVVITEKSNQKEFSAGVFGAHGGENTITLVDYYDCKGAKNIIPKSID